MPAPSTSPTTKTSSMLRLIARLSLGLPWSASATSAAVQRRDLLGVLLGDRPALELHRRGHLVAAGQPVAAHDVEALDLLHAGELRVGGVGAGLDGIAHRWLLGEVLQRPHAEPLLSGPRRREVGVEHD